MNMHDVVDNKLIEKDGIFYLDELKEFNYSDGDTVEKHILATIKKAKDVTSDSRELESYIKDWPTRYHFSRERTLAYRSLNLSSSSKVLEVGSGCGSITRFLGENVSEVLALEGSPRRAKITRERTRDLDNVNVLCASFEDIIFKDTFDVVICNGVLEYAALFVKDANPHIKMITMLRELAGQEGVLIVAIENQFGIRYFSSGREEHTDVMFDGLEGCASVENGPRTFGRNELEKMLKKSFSNVETFIPLPDYKLPSAIIRSEFTDKVNCAELFSNLSRYDFGSVERPLFNERLAWNELHRNGFVKNFANSFFMVASNSSESYVDSEWMGEIFTLKRKNDWCVTTKITESKVGDIKTSKSYFYEGSYERKNDDFTHHLVESAWVDGVSLHAELVKSLHLRGTGSLERRASSLIEVWWGGVWSAYGEEGRLRGEALDCNWQNTIVVDDKVKFIDAEWEWRSEIDSRWLIYRVAQKFLQDEFHYVHRWNNHYQWLTPYQFVKRVGSIVDVKINYLDIWSAMKTESRFQNSVSGVTTNYFSELAMLFIPLRYRYKTKYIVSLARKISRRIKRSTIGLFK